MLQRIAEHHWLLPGVKSTPEGVIELLVHIGVSVSTQTTRNMISSLTKSATHRNKYLPSSMIIYDDFDMDFKVAQPVVGKAGSHTSMTSVTFVPYAHGFMPGDLKFTKELHATSQFNKDIPECRPLIYAPRI